MSQSSRTGFSFVSFQTGTDNPAMWLAPLGDSALVIKLGESIEGGALAAVDELAARLREAALPSVTDIVPAYATITLFYDPIGWGSESGTPFEKLSDAISTLVKSWEKSHLGENAGVSPAHRRREIPVVYGEEFGMDLREVAAHTRLTEAEVIARHCGAEYRVQAIGFAPGFPYLTGLARELETPRRTSPRTEVPAGSVGIGGAQTGVYPMKSPGGWQVIGRTPLKLFDPKRKEPAWLRVGDIVTFRVITPEEFARWK